MNLTTGMRQRIREDLEAVYYYRGDQEQDSDLAPGWYIETGNAQRVGPFDSLKLAGDYARTMPGGVVFPSE